MNNKKEGTDQKDKVKNSKNKLAEMVSQTKKKILQGALTEAHDQLYKFITEEKDKLGGDDSVLLLPGLLTLAEIHIIQSRTKKAEEYLNAAHWSFLKSNDKALTQKKKERGQALTLQEQIDYKINLHRTFAKLYQFKNDYREAINELKSAIYLQSTKWGPQHPYVAQHYFLMGKVFVDMGNQSVGQTFFGKVAEIWYRYLKNFFDKIPQEQQAFLIDQFSLEEAINYLVYIEKHFQEVYEEQQQGLVFTPVMRTYYSIGLLYKMFTDDAQCQAYLKEVYRRCLKFLPEDDRKTAQVRSLLQGMNVNLQGEITPLGRPPQSGREGDDDSLIQGDNDD